MSLRVKAPGPSATEATGTVKAFGGGVVPSGWTECTGQAISRTTFASLFAVIGITYGNGDGVNTFNVPDFRGRSILGEGQGSGLTTRSRGGSGGSEGLSGINTVAAGTDYNAVTEFPNGTAWPSMPPWSVAKWIIKT